MNRRRRWRQRWGGTHACAPPSAPPGSLYCRSKGKAGQQGRHLQLSTINKAGGTHSAPAPPPNPTMAPSLHCTALHRTALHLQYETWRHRAHLRRPEALRLQPLQRGVRSGRFPGSYIARKFRRWDWAGGPSARKRCSFELCPASQHRLGLDTRQPELGQEPLVLVLPRLHRRKRLQCCVCGAAGKRRAAADAEYNAMERDSHLLQVRVQWAGDARTECTGSLNLPRFPAAARRASTQTGLSTSAPACSTPTSTTEQRRGEAMRLWSKLVLICFVCVYISCRVIPMPGTHILTLRRPR